MHFNFITLFPSKIDAYFSEGLQKKALDSGIFSYNTVLLREFGDKWGRVDDTVYGGGPGMLLRVEPIHRALESISVTKGTVILLTPTGEEFSQRTAEKLSKLPKVTFISGYYEGIDHRVTEHLVDIELCIGKYVLSSGDLPALCVADSVLRLLPGFMGGGSCSIQDESFSEDNILDYPQYTKPANYNGWTVPEVLMNGNHGEIKKWKETHRKSPPTVEKRIPT